MPKHRCSRCGKYPERVHWVNDLPVCADDRLCYPGKNLSRKMKKLAELKGKYGGDGNENS